MNPEAPVSSTRLPRYAAEISCFELMRNRIPLADELMRVIDRHPGSCHITQRADLTGSGKKSYWVFLRAHAHDFSKLHL